MKKAIIIVVAVILVAALVGTGAYFLFAREDYEATLDGAKIFENTTEDPIAQVEIANIVREHFKNSKNPKALLIALDGSRADSLFNLVQTEDEDITGVNADSIYSGINYLRGEGGLYLAYAGGPEGENIQRTDTAPGFASILTGTWADQHKVTNNGDVLSESTPTILKELALDGKKVSFTAAWGTHFDLTYKNEVALQMPNYQFHNIQLDNDIFKQAQKSIQENEDCIFLILEAPDGNGHNTGYGNDNPKYIKSVVDSDRYAYALMQEVENRKTYAEEDWLILMVTDHGGTGRDHGPQKATNRFTYIASNKALR